ncbi:MAG: bestrophin family ion channel, partial [Nitrospirales bacterium]|nr:bestrophin family ion channel [Nitrospirales bacterium]
PRILMATIIALIVTIVEIRYGLKEYTLTTTPFTLIGVALGIFLGFRNNASYDRFWEARKLWGSLVNTSRSLARQAYSLTFDTSNSPELNLFREAFVKRVIAFVHAFRHHLRGSDPISDITKFLSPDDLTEVKHSTHRPLFILQQLGRDLAKAKDKGWLPEINVLAIDGQLVELSNILGACERIKNTPIPFTYTVLIHRIVAFYCFFLPFGLIDTAGAMTPIVVFLISHAFFGLDAIGDEIGEPFGMLPNNLALSGMSRTIEINLLELINDPNRPDPERPINGILL